MRKEIEIVPEEGKCTDRFQIFCPSCNHWDTEKPGGGCLKFKEEVFEMACGLCGKPNAFGMCPECMKNTDSGPDEKVEEGKPSVVLFAEEEIHYVYSEDDSLQCADCFKLIFGGEMYFTVFHCDVDKPPEQWHKMERKCFDCFQDDLKIKEIELI